MQYTQFKKKTALTAYNCMSTHRHYPKPDRTAIIGTLNANLTTTTALKSEVEQAHADTHHEVLGRHPHLGDHTGPSRYPPCPNSPQML